MAFNNVFKKVKDAIFAVVISDKTNSLGLKIIGTGVSVGNGKFGITCEHCIISNEQMYISFDLKSKQKISNIKKDRLLDLAVFSIDHSHYVEMTNTKNLEIGEECFLVGYPMKIAQMNAAHSYVSSFFDDNGTKLIRIDSSVNQGNSGGPLFDMEGNLLGIINSKHGNLSEFLNQVESHESQAAIAIGGLDPIVVIKQMIHEMRRNLNLGIGYAVRIEQVEKVEPALKTFIK